MVILILSGVLLFLPLIRCLLSNAWRIGPYILRDLADYAVHRRWREWHGYGLNIYIGMFGKGKSLSASSWVISQARKYRLHCISNVKLSGIDYEPLVNYQQIINAPGNTIIFIDEISTVFNAREWKDFNINLLFQLLQCRKQKKMIVGTAQRFAHVDKLIRDVTSYAIDCTKIWRFRRTRYYDAWDYENCMNAKLIKPVRTRWNFVPQKAYRQYDTSEMIDNAKRMDFKSNEEILVSRGNVQFDELGVKRPKRNLKKKQKS